MPPERTSEKRKLPVARIAIVAIGLLAGGVFLLRGVDVRGAIVRGLELIRAQGPVAYFVAFTLLPAVGVPASVFTLTVGPTFAERFGMPAVVTLSLVAITLNMMLTYALARRALRPVLQRWIARLGYKLPEVPTDDMTDLAIIVRVTPGSPFAVQNYLLGLAGVPFGRYLLVSFIAQLFYTPAFILFGDAVLHGKGKMALLAVSVLVVAVVATHWVRKHYRRKKGPAT